MPLLSKTSQMRRRDSLFTLLCSPCLVRVHVRVHGPTVGVVSPVSPARGVVWWRRAATNRHEGHRVAEPCSRFFVLAARFVFTFEVDHSDRTWPTDTMDTTIP